MPRTTIRQALLQVSRRWLQQAADGDMAIETVDLYIQISERFGLFADAHGIHRMDDVTGQLTERFIGAPGRDRRDNITLDPKTSTRRQRRSALASFFAHARALGMTQAAPLLDSSPIPRPPRSTGAELTDAEIETLQFHSERGMPATRHSALLALLLSGLTSAETAQATTCDLDLTHAAVTTAGATHTQSRTCPLSPWAVHVLRLRADYLGEHRPRQHRLVTSDTSTRYTAQASVGAGFNEIARRSGLATTARKVEPRDITRYVARQLLLETGQVSEVARRLGLSSLDSAAALAGLAWSTCEDTQ
ncbi:site-specific integrase [Streptomyces sp. NPDC001250]|uniref:site-specific integrase n=1 Tax=unclassified Streptomyces TaxID=2593676 RepID=UPI003328A1F9